MSDKLKQGINVLVDFVAGESPTAEKLSAVTSQVRTAVTALEKAVGDIHNQSWPYINPYTTQLSRAWGYERDSNAALANAPERGLDIANLARLIGPAGNLNPRQVPGPKSITESNPAGVYEFSLQFPISGTVNGTNPVFTDASLTTYVAVGEVSAAGQYSVTADGRVNCYTATTGGTVTYTTDPDTYAGGQNPVGATFNTIPDANQIALGAGVNVLALAGNGRHPVTLPVISHQQSNHAGTSIVLSAADTNYSEQLVLPAVLTANLTAGDQIPSGFLFLKNETTKVVYECANYYYLSATSIEVGNLDLTTELAAGDDFSIITVGNDITTAIDDLRVKSHHSHDRSFGEPFAKLDGIIGILAAAGSSGVFVPSKMAGNFAPQYLHRDGYTGDDDNANDYNVLRGDFVIGAAGGSAGSYYTDTGQSFSMYLGTTSGPRIYKDASDNLQILNTLAGADIKLLASDGDIDIFGDDINIDGGLFVSGIHSNSSYSNVAITTNGGAGNIENLGTENGAVFSTGVVAGPQQNLAVWEIDSDAAGAGTYGGFSTGGDWVIPVVQTIFYSEEDAAFESSGSLATDVHYWEYEVALPIYGTRVAADVLGVQVLVQSESLTIAGAGRWFNGASPRGTISSTGSALGSTYGERISYSIGLDNIIRISVAAQGSVSSGVLNAFAHDHPDVVAVPGGFQLPLNLKILLFMAAPGDLL